MPVVFKKKGFINGDEAFLRDSYKPVTLFLTKQDLELFYEHYDINYLEFIDYFIFKSDTGLLNDFITQLPGKNQLEKTLNKMKNNIFIGTFGTQKYKYNKIPKINELGYISFDIIKEINDNLSLYLPIAVAVTSYGREFIINHAQNQYDNFLYSDTDSLHLLELPQNLEIDNDKIGAFKFKKVRIGKYLGCKKYYLEYENLRKKIVCSGLPDSSSFNIELEDFHKGNKIDGKVYFLTNSACTKLINTNFTL